MRQLGEAMKKHERLVVTREVKDPDADMLIESQCGNQKKILKQRGKSFQSVNQSAEKLKAFASRVTKQRHKFYSGEKPV